MKGILISTIIGFNNDRVKLSLYTFGLFSDFFIFYIKLIYRYMTNVRSIRF